MAERDLVRRIFRRQRTPDSALPGGISPLNKEQREAYPSIIYQLETDSPYDLALTQASLGAISAAPLDFKVALDTEGKGKDTKVIVRTDTQDRNDQRAVSALFLGLTEATRARVETDGESADLPEYQQKAQVEATTVLQTLAGKPEMYEAFKKFYGGLRWGLDQEKFVHTLFTTGTAFNPDLLESSLSGYDLDLLTYNLNVDIPYEKRSNWRGKQPAEIFKQNPDLDYHRLDDPAFRETPEGQELLAAYTKLGGDILARRHKNSLEVTIDQDGKQLPKARIPLAQHPIIEALIVNEVAIDRPKAKYDMGARDWTEMILDSDSEPAHQALVSSINTRVSPEHRHVFDGPSEFQHKNRNIWAILREYRSASDDPATRELLKKDLLGVIDAFTGDGDIAASVRADYEARQGDSRKYMREPGEIREIITDILGFALTSPDPEVIGKAEEIVAASVSDADSRLSPVEDRDPLSLNGSDLMLVTIDALKHLTAGSRPQVFETVGTRVFGSHAVGAQLRTFAEMGVQAYQIRTAPDTLRAVVGTRKFMHSFGKDKSPEEIEARKRLADATKPADQLWAEQRQGKNQMLITFLTQITNSGALEVGNPDAAKLFRGFVDRVEFSGYEMTELPQEYHSLINLAEQPNLPESQRNAILWRIQNQFEYVDSKAEHLLLPVVMDTMQVALGPVDAVRLPTDETSHGLSAVTSIVNKHGSEMFKSASEDELATLSGYAKGIVERANQIGLGKMLTARGDEPDLVQMAEGQKEILRNLQRVYEGLQDIAEYYEKYQRVELVKVYPHVYYPWLLEKLAPFWQKMNWEVGPGNRPSRDISDLYRVLEDHVNNKLVLRKPEEYTEDFDVIEEGHIDTLIKAGYDRMIVPHDIKYNTTVWQDGMTFMHYAAGYMPEALLEQMRTKYPNSDFVKYLEKERARWQEEGDK